MVGDIPPGQEHASRPGPFVYVLLAALAGVLLFAIYGASLKRLLGID